MFRTGAQLDRSLLISAFNGKVFAVERGTGNIRWTVALERWGAEIELQVSGGVVIACCTQQLAFIEYSSGRLLRQVELAGKNPGRPTLLVDGEQLLVGRNGEVVCYTQGGDWVWTQSFSGQGYGSVALAFPGNARQADDRGTE